ncbi:hypothetical protein [Lapillicoccus sp.]
MYQSLHFSVVQAAVEQRIRPRPVTGIRRSARLISIEIRRSRRANHGE